MNSQANSKANSRITSRQNSGTRIAKQGSEKKPKNTSVVFNEPVKKSGASQVPVALKKTALKGGKKDEA